ncbi:hypothetical protein IKX73_00665 [Candidatus Saccharibacteria bacterium]|nr:hypothetical protein [Candidatus Saccharibacteria bacterium]
MEQPQETNGIIALVIFMVVCFAIMAVCILSSLKQRKGRFVDTSDATLIKSDYKNAEIGFVYTSMFGKKGAIMTDKNIILLNKNTVNYYSVLDKKGLGKLSSAFLHVLAGHLVGCTVDAIMGEKRRLVFIELNNGKQVLAITTGYYYDDYIQGKCTKKKMDEKDLERVQRILGETNVKL